MSEDEKKLMKYKTLELVSSVCAVCRIMSLLGKSKVGVYTEFDNLIINKRRNAVVRASK